MSPRFPLNRLGLLAIAVATCGVAQARELTVAGFGGASQAAHRAVFFEPFTQATGIKLTEDTYDGGLAKIKAMVESNAVTWDVVDLEGSDLVRGCESGYFDRLDAKQLGDVSSFLPVATSSECGIGFDVWSNILAYDADRLKTPPTSWADFFDLQRFPGKRGLRRSAKFTLEVALLGDGVAPADVYKLLATPAGVDRAFKALDRIKPSIQWWQAGAQPAQWLAAGDVVMSTAYNGRIDAANQGGKHLGIVWNQQIYSLDYWALVRGSPFRDQGMKLIAFMSQPERLARLPERIPYGVPNTAATALIPPAIAEQLPTSPAHLRDALASSNQFWLEHEDDLNERFNAWAAR